MVKAGRRKTVASARPLRPVLPYDPRGRSSLRRNAACTTTASARVASPTLPRRAYRAADPYNTAKTQTHLSVASRAHSSPSPASSAYSTSGQTPPSATSLVVPACQRPVAHSKLVHCSLSTSSMYAPCPPLSPASAHSRPLGAAATRLRVTVPVVPPGSCTSAAEQDACLQVSPPI